MVGQGIQSGAGPTLITTVKVRRHKSMFSGDCGGIQVSSLYDKILVSPGSTHSLIRTVDRLCQRVKKEPLLLQLEELLLYLCEVGRRVVEPGGVAANKLGKVVNRGKGIHCRAEDRCSSNACLHGTRSEDHDCDCLKKMKQTSKRCVECN